MAQRENGHLGFQLKPAAQGWEIFHEAAAERPVAGHDVGERGPEEAVYGGPDQIVPQRMEIPAVLPLVRTVRQPVADHHVRPAVEHGLQNPHQCLGRIRIVSVHHDIGVGIDVAKHAADDVTFALGGFGDDAGSGPERLAGRPVRRIVVVDVNFHFRQATAEIGHDLGYGRLLVVTGNQQADFFHSDIGLRVSEPSDRLPAPPVSE